VHLAGQRLHLRVGLVALAGERRDLGLDLCDVSVDLAPLIAAEGYVEARLCHRTTAKGKQLTTAVRHDSILTRKVPSCLAYASA